ncbi:MAG: glycerol dehydrogenase [Propionibacteriaceae bacterium]|jgi:glycerol dehydrogenase|nr:glycerol dehydrogenase [Propionibacteriaceae bacterium]
MTKKAILLPRKFVQGPGVITEIGDYAKMLGTKAVVLWGKSAKAAVGEKVTASLAAADVAMIDVGFNGETTKAEAERVAEIAKSDGASLIIGIGGGKCLDAAKGAAIFAQLPHIIVPSVASNDAPTSACTVWYDEEGVCTGFDLWPANPDYILVDTEVIVKAPFRLFAAGIGDAIATWYEADINRQKRAVTCSGGTATLTAMAMAKLCRDTILEYGLRAIEDIKVQALTPSVDKVIEATTLLSGIGWESGGLATAHQLANAFPALPETHHYLHGEKVSFGLVCQFCVDDDIDPDLVEATVEFQAAAGLPVTFADLNLQDVSDERLYEFCEAATTEGSFVYNHPNTITAADLFAGMKSADALGRRIKAQLGLA